MNFTPVAIGSDTDSRGMIPGAFSSTRRRVLALMGPAVHRVAEGIDDAAEQLVSDRHVDDGSR